MKFLYFHLRKFYRVPQFHNFRFENIRATVSRKLEPRVGLASLAFFYCDFKEDRKKKLRGLLSSSLVQLYHESDTYDILSKLYSEHDNGSRPPSDDARGGCLKDLLKLPGLAPIYRPVSPLQSPKHHRGTCKNKKKFEVCASYASPVDRNLTSRMSSIL